jgi:magnesium transporter
MRSLALREIGISHWLRVSRKEMAAGFFNGLAIALITALGVLIWSDSQGLAMVIGISMIIAMVMAGIAGVVIPMVLSRMGQDPAQSSSIILTTVTDIVGFFSFLGIASALSTLL